MKILRDRFKRTIGGDSALQILLNWCALPGSADARDQQRAGKFVASLQRRRGGAAGALREADVQTGE